MIATIGTGATLVDPAELDQLGAQLLRDARGCGAGGDDQQRIAAVKGLGERLAGRGLFSLLDSARVDQAAVLGVLADHGRVTVAQPQRGWASPGFGEPADFGELVGDATLGDVGERAARADGDELAGVADKQQLQARRSQMRWTLRHRPVRGELGVLEVAVEQLFNSRARLRLAPLVDLVEQAAVGLSASA